MTIVSINYQVERERDRKKEREREWNSKSTQIFWLYFGNKEVATVSVVYEVERERERTGKSTQLFCNMLGT